MTADAQGYTRSGWHKEGGIFIKAKFLAISGFLGGIIARIMGGFTRDLKTLLLLMAIDFLTGLMVAGIFKNSHKTQSGALSSKTGFKGIAKKCIALCFVLIAHRLDLLLGISFARTAVILAYITNELISIIENAGLMGVPVPAVIKKAIDILNEKQDTKKEDFNDKDN